MSKKIDSEQVDELFKRVIENIQHTVYQLMEDENLNLTELAVLTEINYQSLWKMLNNDPGKLNYKLHTLIRIAEGLEIDLRDLFENYKGLRQKKI